MGKRLYLAVFLILVLAGGLWYLMKPELPPTAPGSAVEQGITLDKALPAFSLSSLEGKTIAVKTAGKVMVINFWATWCPPCRAEMPELNRFAQKYSDSVDFYGINLQEPVEKVTSFMNQNGYTMPVLLDEGGEAGRTFMIKAIPTTLIVNKSGIIVFRKSGGVTEEELVGVIKGL